jgi:chromosome segregation ATPase
MEERLAFIEKTVGESVDKHAKALEDAKKRLDQLHKDHHEHRSGFGNQLQKHASLEERMEFFEKCIGDSADKHTQGMKDAQSKLDQLHARLSKVEKHGDSIDELNGHMKKHASTSERLDYLEKAVGDSADKHDSALEALESLRNAHGRHSDAHGKHAKELEILKSSHAAHASLEERMNFLEKTVGDSADKHSKAFEELESLKTAHGRHADAHGKHASELDNLKRSHAAHASLEERMKFVEKNIGDSADRHAEELAAAHARVDKVHGSLTELQKAHAALEKDHKAKNSHHATMAERMAFLEQSLGDSADKHSKELEALRLAHTKHEQAHAGHVRDLQGIKAITEKHATVGERLDYVERMLGDSADKHAAAIEAAQAQLEHVHGRLLQCEKHGTAIGELRKVHSALASEKAALDTHHATLQERVDYIENMLGSSADRHQAEIEALKASHSKHAKLLQDVKAAHTHHASLPERMTYLEKMLGDSAESTQRKWPPPI